MKPVNISKLLKGISIPTDDSKCFVKSLTLGEIADKGENEFFKYKALFSYSDTDIFNETQLPTLFDYLRVYYQSNKLEVETAAQWLLGEVIIGMNESGFITEFGVLTYSTFQDIRHILKMLYGETRMNTMNFKDEATRQGYLKAQEQKRKRRKPKEKVEEPINVVADFVMALVSGGYTYEEAWRVPFYAASEYQKLISKKENYFHGLLANLMGAFHGGKKFKSQKLTYYIGG